MVAADVEKGFDTNGSSEHIHTMGIASDTPRRLGKVLIAGVEVIFTHRIRTGSRSGMVRREV